MVKRFKAILGASALLACGASASAQDIKLAPHDLAVAMAAYVDGVVELRQFLKACAPTQPAGWEEGADLVVASVKAAGVTESVAGDLSRRFTLEAGPSATYDCAGPVARARLEFARPTDWPAYHGRMLTNIGVEIVKPVPENDPKLAAAWQAVAGHMAPQSTMLGCMALTEPQGFALAYADWNQALDRAAAIIREADYSAAVAAEIVEPARSANLMAPVDDRQAAITGCIADAAWMDRFGGYGWYLVVDDVRKAVGGKN